MKTFDGKATCANCKRRRPLTELEERRYVCKDRAGCLSHAAQGFPAAANTSDRARYAA